MSGRARTAGLVLLALTIGPLAQATATFQLQITDAAMVGFNDPTPFTPVGGNNAATLGQARRNAFNEATRLWGQIIDSSVPVVVSAGWAAQTCSVTSGTLGGAGAAVFFRDFGSGQGGVWYPAALADALAGRNITSGADGTIDITATFNSSVNNNPGCLQGASFYLGFDHNAPGGSIDFLPVLLHELGHGLGFVSIVDQNGMGYVNGGVERFSIFDQFVYDESLHLLWPQLSDAQRAQSETRSGQLSWNGARVNANIGTLTAGTVNGHVRLYAPAIYNNGSSVSHFDSVATPSLLMEPNVSSSLRGNVDLTSCALYDMGWGGPGVRCPDTGPVNAAPVANAQLLQTNENSALAVTLSGSDVNGDSLSFRVTSNPLHGAISGAAPTISYTPAANFTGADSFSFVANDGSVDSAPATIGLTINPTGQGGTNGSASSGGGGFDWIELLMIVALIGWRWRQVGAPPKLG